LFFYAEFSYSLVNIYFEVPHDLCISKLLAEWMYTAPDRWIRGKGCGKRPRSQIFKDV
jgi:hypothetical protein